MVSSDLFMNPQKLTIVLLACMGCSSGDSSEPPPRCGAAYAIGEPAVEQVTIFQGGEDGYPVYRIPAAVTTNTGALLAFAGVQLALVIRDMSERRDLFVVVMILGIALATNLAVGFVIGIVLAYALRSKMLEV